jgi:hypothetical protein
MSLAGADAARARREAALQHLSNLRLGPTAWAFKAGLGTEYTDNLQATADDEITDISLRPQIATRMEWAVSEMNTLNFSLGAGYAFYAMHPEYNRPFVTPGSEAAFDFYAGDFWINVHDRFSIQENGYLDPTATGIGDYERLENAAGLSTTWDLNKVILKLGYDHVNYLSLGGLRGSPDAALDVFSSSSAWLLRPKMLLGLEAGGTLVAYDNAESASHQPNYSDGAQWNVGAFWESQITEYISGRASVGYTAFSPENPQEQLASEEFTGIYLQLGLTHRVNKHLDYTLTGGRLLNFAYYGGRVDRYFATVDAHWNVLWKTALRTSLSYQHGTQAGGRDETYDWLGPTAAVERKISPKLIGSLAYRFYWRGSDLPDRRYEANIFLLHVTYVF